jgi:hypothetical protein
MAYIPDFDLEDMLSVLYSVIEKQAEGSKERDVIEFAQIALFYIYHARREDDFKAFYKHCFDASFKIEVSHGFATREEADEWLASGNAKDAERVKIAGKGFMVVEVTGKLYFMPTPHPEEMETDEWKDDSDEEDSE